MGSALQQLKDKKLLFGDGDRFMSIAFKQRPNRIMSDLQKWAA